MTAKPVHVAFMVGSLRIGGAERMMIHTANELSGHMRTSFLSLTGGEELKSEVKNSVRLFSFGKKKSLSAIPDILRFIRTEKPDVIISTQIHVNLVAVLLKIIFGVKAKIVLREATSPGSQFIAFNDFKSRLVKMAVKILYPRADAIVAICEAVRSNLVEHRFARPSQISVIYNPVVNSNLAEKIKYDVEHDFFNAGVPVIISVGRLAPAKNFSLLVEAFGALSKNFDARLIIIGDGPEKEKLISQVKESGLEDKIFLAGKIMNPYPWLKKSSVYVLTSLFEGLPNALIEAMACGVQLVSVDCPGGSKEVLMNGALGKLVELNNPAALADAIREACESPVDREQLTDSSKRFEARITADGYLSLINNLVK